jgi:predicted nucleotidyltransferase
MDSLIEDKLEEIGRLCRQYRVRRLAAFGSILRGDFDPVRSDADFLVEFEPVPVSVRMQNYIGLRGALSLLLSRPVDLVEDGAIRNPYILKNVAEQEQVLNAA